MNLRDHTFRARVLMVLAFISVFLVLMPCFAAESAIKTGMASPPAVSMAIIDTTPKSEFEEKRLAFLKDQLKPCSSCEIKNLTPYGDKGVPARDQFGAALEKAAEEASFVFLPWNEKNGNEWIAFVESMKKVTSKGTVIIAFAGRPVAGAPPAMLNRTVMGQVPDVFILGELSDKERLIDNTFFGPELLTAVRPPPGMTGQDRGADLFVTKLLMSWNKKKSANEWAGSFKSTKLTSRRIWPALEDFFPR